MIPRLYVVDDEAPARARMATLLSDIAEQCPHQLVGMASQAQDALDEILQIRPDIVLLDVQMPGMNGLELATHLSAMASDAPAVIFISAHDEYAIKAFDVHALDYLLKPVRAARLAEAIGRVCALRMQLPMRKAAIAETVAALQMKRRHFSVQERGRLLLVPVNEVIYLKAELKYVTLRTMTRDYLLEASLSSIEEEFGEIFVRVHRNALVARKAIIGVERGSQPVDPDGDNEKAQESWQVILRDVDDRLPISRRQWSVIKTLVR
jgi:two-component system, LytTR family, response regulator AlgR